MKEYKLIHVRKCQAEAKMNEMAKEGWAVVSTAFWFGLLTHTLLITFARDI